MCELSRVERVSGEDEESFGVGGSWELSEDLAVSLSGDDVLCRLLEVDTASEAELELAFEAPPPTMTGPSLAYVRAPSALPLLYEGKQATVYAKRPSKISQRRCMVKGESGSPPFYTSLRRKHSHVLFDAPSCRLPIDAARHLHLVSARPPSSMRNASYPLSMYKPTP